MTGCMKGALMCFTSVTPSASKPLSGLGTMWGSECLWTTVWPRSPQMYILFPDMSSLKMGKHWNQSCQIFIFAQVYQRWQRNTWSYTCKTKHVATVCFPAPFLRCLVDSQLPGSKSHFLVRKKEDKLRLVIDAFRFHNEERREVGLY